MLRARIETRAIANARRLLLGRLSESEIEILIDRRDRDDWRFER
jgi:hypothetical protein